MTVAWSIARYEPSSSAEWDAFVQASKNGTFILLRPYMDYHQDRFVDHSLLLRRNDRTVALLPANRSGDALYSHQGLTYGGFIVSEAMTTPVMLEAFDCLRIYLRQSGISNLYYKTVPSIYHTLPAEEDRYALFRNHASLARRDVLSVVVGGRRGPLQERRRRSAAKARKHRVVVDRCADWSPFWTLLTEHLMERYNVSPVHSLEEIDLLRRRFPKNISLFDARIGGETVAGVVIFETTMVAHVQYIAASPRGREAGALDAVFEHLIADVFAQKPFFDFGISNEQEGRYLNLGLIEQKEGLGARAVVHDHYRLE